VAERPEGAVGEAVVVPRHLLLGERHLAEGELRALRRHPVARLQAGLAFRLPGDPDSARAAHHRLERADQPAGGALELDALGGAPAHVRLAVGDQQQAPVAEEAARQSVVDRPRRDRDRVESSSRSGL
jgi:hypothetical protein